MNNTYFISDLHFGHKNCLTFDSRPFRTIEEHDEELIMKWNRTVLQEDDVYILGDVSWKNNDETIKILKRLPGNKHLIIGNHDHKMLKDQRIRDLFVEIVDYKEIKICSNDIILSHYPIPCFNKHYYGAYHFYGHIHNSFEWDMMERVKYEMIRTYNKPCNMFNVGCMVPGMDYTPRTFEQIISNPNCRTVELR